MICTDLEVKIITVSDGKVGPMAGKFFKALTDIQYGREKGTMGWIEEVNI